MFNVLGSDRHVKIEASKPDKVGSAAGAFETVLLLHNFTVASLWTLGKVCSSATRRGFKHGLTPVQGRASALRTGVPHDSASVMF